MEQEKKIQKTKVKKSKPVGYGFGHRKTARARVWLRRGTGKLVVNKKAAESYFDTAVELLDAKAPFRCTPIASNYDIEANVSGGGKCGQAGAISVGIARALVEIDETLRTALRKDGLLTIDSRQVERKKYGQRGARRKFQFTKR